MKRKPNGHGNITTKGYCRVYDKIQKRIRMQHVLVWERFNGKVPTGFQIHHINGNKLDNRVENLEMVSQAHHSRLHAGRFEIIDGLWWKTCPVCKKFKMLESDYYRRLTGFMWECKVCCKAKSQR